jgi:hypothetical protein
MIRYMSIESKVLMGMRIIDIKKAQGMAVSKLRRYEQLQVT